ncbi:hypothetical protein Pmar_PMAR006600 [Perkinsus marinus ATCC 50983]|uniref:Uncharacterized protein n=1 Tax=Perkinsus marinus (strain ATCC 50983 / TXsc) TaxID=423536 RepID=C5LLQ5_PERM5|nr:hypothetical protein Pmar_PMAR006600 [Perkinsus marinus ATCC 50983]EER02277.1 hypothetical protein Pmar_PMAR006600 [Perkinsus marinus ATCC 50983]|eukprot:XP_002769559.1 hypothetical protein Pmar_PMAR006600 [Perkinsus marinus ATCC 50983]
MTSIIRLFIIGVLFVLNSCALKLTGRGAGRGAGKSPEGKQHLGKTKIGAISELERNGKEHRAKQEQKDKKKDKKSWFSLAFSGNEGDAEKNKEK